MKFLCSEASVWVMFLVLWVAVFLIGLSLRDIYRRIKP
jgi:hypothetical protein